MLEGYLALGTGAGMAIGKYFLNIKKLEKEFDKACEENKKPSNGLCLTLDNIEKRKELSRLVACLNNYLDLRTHSRN